LLAHPAHETSSVSGCFAIIVFVPYLSVNAS
jgi:hypothetical protein